MKLRWPVEDLLRLFAALGPDAERLCLLAGVAGQGFPDTLAWNPSARLEGGVRPDRDLQREIVDFGHEHTRRGRLVVGFCSYELGQHWQGLASRHEPAAVVPAYSWLAYDNWLTREAEEWTLEVADNAQLKLLEAAQRQARQAAAGPASWESMSFERMQFQPGLTLEAYARAFERIAEHIRAGDIYQVNLTYPLQAQTELGDRELFPFVARSNPVEHLAYLEGPGYSIQSASPERFVRIRGRQIETVPIKGTRPRGADAEQDRERLAELLASAKEAAELNMITDLLRNDLARVCKPGSVQVAEQRVAQAGPKVWHTASRITGELLETRTALEAVLCLLPGGSISGCPKRRALQLIDELETGARGVYTGVIGRLAPDTSCDFSVAIRTLVKQGSQVTLGVGGGIVLDSTLEHEYAETRHKAASFLQLPATRPRAGAHLEP